MIDGVPSIGAAAVTFRGEDNRLDMFALGGYFTLLRKTPVELIITGGTTGGGQIPGPHGLVYMDVMDRIILTQAAVRIGGWEVLPNVSGFSIADCVANTKALIEACPEIEAVLCLPPTSSMGDPVTDFIELAEEISELKKGLRILIYLFPQLTGVNMTAADVVAIMSHCPNVIGLKASTDNHGELRALCQTGEPRLGVGNEGLAYALMEEFGARFEMMSGLCAIPKFAMFLYTMFEKFVSGDREQAKKMSDAILELISKITINPEVPFYQVVTAMVVLDCKLGSYRSPEGGEMHTAAPSIAFAADRYLQSQVSRFGIDF